jgi:hypothetical protein
MPQKLLTNKFGCQQQLNERKPQSTKRHFSRKIGIPRINIKKNKSLSPSRRNYLQKLKEIISNKPYKDYKEKED